MKRCSATPSVIVLLLTAPGSGVLAQADSLEAAFTGGKASGQFNLRYEGVSEDGMAEDAQALRFTHTAIAIYSTVMTTDGRQLKGYAIHNLYQKADRRDESYLLQDYPVDFFWPVQALKAGVLIPEPGLQQALVDLIARGDHLALHNPAYSVLANPYNTRYQNCTEYTLDLVNAAIYNTLDLARLKANARAHFQATPIRETPFRLFLGSLFAADTRLDDHQDVVATATFTSIARYLQDNGLLEQAVILTPEGAEELL